MGHMLETHDADIGSWMLLINSWLSYDTLNTLFHINHIYFLIWLIHLLELEIHAQLKV